MIIINLKVVSLGKNFSTLQVVPIFSTKIKAVIDELYLSLQHKTNLKHYKKI